MAANTAQKRFSAMNLGSPWRGLNVDPAEVGITDGNRQAVMFMYSGILAAAADAPVVVAVSKGTYAKYHTRSRRLIPFALLLGELVRRYLELHKL